MCTNLALNKKGLNKAVEKPKLLFLEKSINHLNSQKGETLCVIIIIIIIIITV